MWSVAAGWGMPERVALALVAGLVVGVYSRGGCPSRVLSEDWGGEGTGVSGRRRRFTGHGWWGAQGMEMKGTTEGGRG